MSQPPNLPAGTSPGTDAPTGAAGPAGRARRTAGDPPVRASLRAAAALRPASPTGSSRPTASLRTAAAAYGQPGTGSSRPTGNPATGSRPRTGSRTANRPAPPGYGPPPWAVPGAPGGPPPKNNRTTVIALVVAGVVVLAAVGAVLWFTAGRRNDAASLVADISATVASASRALATPSSADPSTDGGATSSAEPTGSQDTGGSAGSGIPPATRQPTGLGDDPDAEQLRAGVLRRRHGLVRRALRHRRRPARPTAPSPTPAPAGSPRARDALCRTRSPAEQGQACSVLPDLEGTAE